jgi:hypothetical protein
MTMPMTTTLTMTTTMTVAMTVAMPDYSNDPDDRKSEVSVPRPPDYIPPFVRRIPGPL